MIKSIPLRRASPASSLNDPVQTSENLQIAINNGSQLTILDPKLPSIHKTLTLPAPGKDPILDPSDLFDTSSTLWLEQLESFGIRSLSNLLVETCDQTYHLSRIFEPQIISHKWSPLNPLTKDCYLGILLNTSELFILERQTLDLINYRPAFKIFNNLLDQLYLSRDKIAADGKIKVNNEQYSSLMIESFEFSQVMISEGEAIPLLSIGTGSNEISIHQLNKSFTKLLTIENQPSKIVKQVWSKWKKSDSNNFTSFLSFIYADNRVTTAKLFFDISTSEMSIGKLTKVLPNKSRFEVHELAYTETDQLIVISSTSMRIFQLLKGNEMVIDHKLQHRSRVSSVLQFNKYETLTVDLAYENGKFERVEITNKVGKFSSNSTLSPKLFQALVNREMYRYEILKSKAGGDENGEASGEQPPNLAQKPFLNDSVSLRYYNAGTKLMESNGMIVTVGRIIPQNVLNYVISSQLEYSVNFTHIKDIYPDYDSKDSLIYSTSTNKINSFWFNYYKKIPIIPTFTNERNAVSDIDEFLSKIQSLKMEVFGSLNEKTINIKDSAKGTTFQQFLFSNFTANADVSDFQKAYNFNMIILKSLFFLSSKQINNEEINKVIQILKEEQLKIEVAIVDFMISLVLKYFTNLKEQLLTEVDKFLIISYVLHLQSQGVSVENIENIPEKAELLVKTDFFEEEFEVSKNDIIADDERILKVVTSKSGHKWSRCSLSLYPLLELNNQMDEMKKFNYTVKQTNTESNESIINNLLSSLNFCIYTGNKTYNVN